MLTKQAFGERYVGPLPSVWAITPLASGGYEIRLPNRQVVSVAAGQWEWDRSFEVDSASTKLWFHSLQWLPYLWLDHGDAETCLDGFNSYRLWLDGIARDESYRPFNSQDHAHALQLRAACALVAGLVCKSPEVAEQASTEIEEFLKSLLAVATKPEYLLPNNHGLMLGRSFLETSVVFADSQLVGELEKRACAAIDFVIDEVFDSDGVACENTPGYQDLYVRVIEAIVAFAREADVAHSARDSWAQVAEHSRRTLEHMTYRDGTLPAVGDDAGSRTYAVQNPGVFYSESNGIYYASAGPVELSIICGYASPIHKHMDDASLRLRVADEDLIVDAGLLSYDVHDPISVSMSSQRGHSGIHFPRFDAERSQSYYFASPPRVCSSMTRTQDGESDRLECSVVVDGEWRINRTYTRNDWNSLVIEDSFVAPGGDRPTRRFLVHEDAAVDVRGSVVHITRAHAWARLTFHEDCRIAVFHGETEPLPKGWRARALYEEVACWLIEVDMPESGSAETTVEWGTVDSDETRRASESEGGSVGVRVNGHRYVVPWPKDHPFETELRNGEELAHRVYLDACANLVAGASGAVLDVSTHPETHGLMLALGWRKRVLLAAPTPDRARNLEDAVRRGLVADRARVWEGTLATRHLVEAMEARLQGERIAMLLADSASTWQLEALRSRIEADRPVIGILSVRGGRNQRRLSALLESVGYRPTWAYRFGARIYVPCRSRQEMLVYADRIASNLTATNLQVRDLAYKVAVLEQRLAKFLDNKQL